LLHYPSGRRPYNREELQRLLLAIHAREARLVDRDGRPVPAEAEWKFSPHDGILEVIGPNRPPDYEYPNPRLVVPLTPALVPPRSVAAAPADKPGPKPGVSGKERVGQLADEILSNEKTRPEHKRGWKTRLAELIHEQLTDEGYNYDFESVRRTLRDIKIEHPGKRIESG
jgi:hypothetical protein